MSDLSGITDQVSAELSGASGADPQGQDIAIGQDFMAQVDVQGGKLEDLKGWLADEITQAKADRTGLDEKLILWAAQYEAMAQSEKKSWPWEHASNLTVGITAAQVDQALSMFMGSVFATDKIWAGRPRSSKQVWMDAAQPIEDWLNWMGREKMDMYNVCRDWFLGMEKYGTGILKLPWVKNVRKVIYKDSTGATVQELAVKQNGPQPMCVPLADFFVTSDAYQSKNIQTCEGVFQRYYRTKKQLEEDVTSKKFATVEGIIGAPRTQLTDLETQANQTVGVEVSTVKDYELFECWVSYDIDGDGQLEELIVDFHPESRTILRAVYNFYRHQERPFHLIRYMPRENHLFGVGICQMLEDIQVEVTTLHNQRVDNGTLANTRMWKRMRNSLIDDVEIYPGAFIDVDNMDDITPIQMGDIYPSQLREELHVTSLGERRTGLSEYNVGRESAAIGSRATATSTLALIQQGNRRFAMTINDIRQALGDIAHQVIMLQQQFGQNDQVMYELFDEKQGQLVQQFFKMPVELSRANIAIDVPAISESANKDMDKQSLLSLMQLMQQYYMSLFQAIQMQLNPQVPPQMQQLAGQAAQSASRLWERILTAFDIKDADTFVPNLTNLLSMQSAMEGMNGQQGTGGIGTAPVGQQEMGAGEGGASEAEILGALASAGGGAGVPGEGGGPAAQGQILG